MSGLKVGNYVLATKHSNGCATDPWAYGAIIAIHYTGQKRAYQLDSGPTQCFSTARRITKAEGLYFRRHARDLKRRSVKLWTLLRQLRRGQIEGFKENIYED